VDDADIFQRRGQRRRKGACSNGRENTCYRQAALFCRLVEGGEGGMKQRDGSGKGGGSSGGRERRRASEKESKDC